MKKRNMVGILGAVLIAAACVPSVHPFYTEKDVFFEPKILGEWVDKKDDSQSWVFEKGNETNAYKLIINESGGKRGEFEAHVFKLKENVFLDMIVTDLKLATNQAEFVTASLIAGHLLARVLKVDSGLELAFMDPDWLDKHLQEHPTAVSHLIQQKRVILTAPTRDLQSFVLQHLEKEQLFGGPVELVKKAAAPK